VTGTALAALSGAGFGVFQTLNAQAVRGLENAYVATFLQLLAAGAVLSGAALATEDPSALLHASGSGLLLLALAGFVHFFVGWTALNLSHVRIGAARTSPLLATTPLFGLGFALLFTGQVPRAIALAGIALTVAGSYLVAVRSGDGGAPALRDSAFGIATAAAWALAAVLTVEGLERFDSALLGVTVGLFAAALAYALLLALIRPPLRGAGTTRSGVGRSRSCWRSTCSRCRSCWGSPRRSRRPGRKRSRRGSGAAPGWSSSAA
jgi:drug/metabolite transporter (DMT)-like permease